MSFVLLSIVNEYDVIDLKGIGGKTPLIVASMFGEVDVVKYLVTEKKADVNLQDNGGRTALYYASESECNEIDIVDILIKNGTKDLKDKINNKSALDIAKEKRHEKIVKLLQAHFKTK